MGWSLGGILGAVGKAVGDTAQDWAHRGIIEDEKIASEERATARAKEMADYQEQIATAREERVQALKEKADLQTRDKNATTVGALEWAATKDPEGPKLQKGTVAFHDWMSSQLSASGEEAMAKNQADMAAKLRDDVRADKQLDVSMANAAASRAQSAASLGAAREDRLANLDLKREELKGKQEKEHRADMANLGTLQFKDKASGEDMKDSSGYPVLRKVDATLETTYGMTDRLDRVDAMAQISANARSYYAQQAGSKKPVSWDVALQKSASEWAVKNPPPEPKAKK
jgi:hypothetical protein